MNTHTYVTSYVDTIDTSWLVNQEKSTIQSMRESHDGINWDIRPLQPKSLGTIDGFEHQFEIE